METMMHKPKTSQTLSKYDPRSLKKAADHYQGRIDLIDAQDPPTREYMARARAVFVKQRDDAARRLRAVTRPPAPSRRHTAPTAPARPRNRARRTPRTTSTAASKSDDPPAPPPRPSWHAEREAEALMNWAREEYRAGQYGRAEALAHAGIRALLESITPTREAL